MNRYITTSLIAMALSAPMAFAQDQAADTAAEDTTPAAQTDAAKADAQPEAPAAATADDQGDAAKPEGSDAAGADAKPDAAKADAPFKPERLTVKETIAPGPNVYVMQEAIDGAGSIGVFSQEDLSVKELLPTGTWGIMAISKDGKTAWAQSSFLKRITYGPIEQILTRFDIETGKIVSETSLPTKAAMALAYDAYLRETDGGKYVLVQNATPATSVTVVDTETEEVTQEIPTPGCWGIFPANSGQRFFSVCGDGKLKSYAISEDGTSVETTVSEKVFDPDADPIFIDGERLGDEWVFVSYKGEILRISDKDATPVEAGRFSITEGQDGEWAPGGYGVMAVNPTTKTAYVGMHPEAYDGSHKLAMEEVWAVDLEDETVTNRAHVEDHLASLAVSPGDSPALFGVTHDNKMVKYDIDGENGLSKAAEVGVTGYALNIQVVK